MYDDEYFDKYDDDRKEDDDAEYDDVKPLRSLA